ncbi:hypothetical protein GFY24_00945 [Nocardia sp. SYP-A9097]|uniref:hypothetical protein n=1 Tax=Nocardia sp. SYP-A9097 TaxID=2663237 RepID=UPI00129B60FC|nr:hypothetical protein [Nocardia sp. SYP-A9097]MRH86044.1 hypothetical protein [Nocardia sp. SYP-A9097]
MIENAGEITTILRSAESLMRAAIAAADSDPALAVRSIESAIGAVQSVRGFLL